MTRQPYPSDLTDRQWARLEPLLPPAKPGGQPRRTDPREVMNAILSVLRNGIVGRALPHDFPPWETVYYYFTIWRRAGVWEQAHDLLRAQVRQTTGRDPQRGDPRQPVGQADGNRGPRGYDAAKQVNGRKRHILVDMLGLLLIVVVHAANIQESAGATLVLWRALGRFPRLRLIWVDQGYQPHLVDGARAGGGWVVEIVARPKDQQGFTVLPRRWVVERTFAWLGRCRRLSKDDEGLPETHEAWGHLGMIHLMLKRLTR
jgi:putative transposase